MSDDVATRIIVFAWLTAVPVAVFAWFSVSHWINARTAERKDRERNALLRHLAGQPAEGARLVLEKMREDEEQARKDAAAQADACRQLKEQNDRDVAARALPFGVIVVAASIGLSIFLYSVTDDDDKGVWTLGLIPLLVGLVITGGALYRRRETATSERDGSPSSTAR
jgi:ABC-type multidrug transport system fused ATPase/permease subunit